MPQMAFLFLCWRELTEEQEQCSIVKTAVKIIENAIKELHAKNDSFSSPDGMESSKKR